MIAIPERYDPKPYAFGFQKNSPYLGLFNYYLNDMRERGRLQQIFKKYANAPQKCPDYSGQALGFNSCFTAFLILLVGFGSSAMLWAMERLAKELGYSSKIPIPDPSTRKNVEFHCKHELEVAKLKMELKQMKSNQRY